MLEVIGGGKGKRKAQKQHGLHHVLSLRCCDILGHTKNNR
jgi:hypothetical protein